MAGRAGRAADTRQADGRHRRRRPTASFSPSARRVDVASGSAGQLRMLTSQTPRHQESDNRMRFPSLAPSRALITAASTSVVTMSIGLLTGIASAWAHVRADADNPSPGSTSVVTFRVPGESENGALTTQLSVELPDVASARTEVMPGWTARLERDTQRAPSPRSPGRPIRRRRHLVGPVRAVPGFGQDARGRQRHLPRHADLLRWHSGALGSGPVAGRR